VVVGVTVWVDGTTPPPIVVPIVGVIVGVAVWVVVCVVLGETLGAAVGVTVCAPPKIVLGRFNSRARSR
jgi:hypothetical protein